MFTKQSIIDNVLSRLGGNSISVEMTTDDWNQLIPSMLNTYNIYRPKLIDTDYTIVTGKQDYQLTPQVAGRGVFQLIPPEAIQTPASIFPSEYFPLSQGQKSSSIDLRDYITWRIKTNVESDIIGTKTKWSYNQDSKVFHINPNPTYSFRVKLKCLHDRYFTECILFTGNGSDKVISEPIIDPNGNHLYNINPFTFYIKCRTSDSILRFEDNGVGILTTSPSSANVGTIDYVNGTFTLNLVSPVLTGNNVILTINELRGSDEEWCKDYCFALASMIVGAKRNRFKNLPGTQSAISLDGDKETQGKDLKLLLDKQAKLWAMEWIISRKL